MKFHVFWLGLAAVKPCEAQGEKAAPGNAAKTAPRALQDNISKEQRAINHAFVDACARGDVAKFEDFLAKGASKDAMWDEINFEGYRCADAAAQQATGDYLSILDKLTAAGHPVDKPATGGSSYGRVALWQCALRHDDACWGKLFPHTKNFAGRTVRGDNLESFVCGVAESHHPERDAHESFCKDMKGKHSEEATKEVKRRLEVRATQQREAKRHDAVDEALNPIRRLHGVEETIKGAEL